MLRVGFLGCGDVAARYATTLAGREIVRIVAATDPDRTRADEFAARFGGAVRASLEELLQDENVDCVVNLTPAEAHAEVTALALEAGKHVHSEKPLATTHPEAQTLVELAERAGQRLSCAPITFLGDAQQAAWNAIRDGLAGPIRLVYADVNHGRIETWHPRPEPFYAIGPVFDVGVYPLTILTAFFGPVRRVAAWGATLLAERVTLEGNPFRVQAPDLVVAAVELESGVVARLTANYYVGEHGKEREGMEFHGDAGSVYLGSWAEFDAEVEFAPYDGSYEPVFDPAGALPGIDFGRALTELAAAIEEGRPHAASGAHAAHVVEVLVAIGDSAGRGEPVEVCSRFEPPPAP